MFNLIVGVCGYRKEGLVTGKVQSYVFLVIFHG